MIDKTCRIWKENFAGCKNQQKYQFILKFERNNLLCNVREEKRSGTTFCVVTWGWHRAGLQRSALSRGTHTTFGHSDLQPDRKGLNKIPPKNAGNRVSVKYRQ
jgi:hypothetical protein